MHSFAQLTFLAFVYKSLLCLCKHLPPCLLFSKFYYLVFSQLLLLKISAHGDLWAESSVVVLFIYLYKYDFSYECIKEICVIALWGGPQALTTAYFYAALYFHSPQAGNVGLLCDTKYSCSSTGFIGSSYYDQYHQERQLTGTVSS